MTLSSTTTRELSIWAELNAALANHGVAQASARAFLREGLLDGSSTEALDYINGASGSFDVAKIVAQLRTSDRGELAMRDSVDDTPAAPAQPPAHYNNAQRMTWARAQAQQ